MTAKFPTAYLAGPDVFLPDAKAVGRAKCEILLASGIVGLFPLDNEVPESQDFAHEIFLGNVQLINRSALMLANIIPFRGPSLDPGTAWEIGYAYARGIPVICYGSSSTYLERCRALGWEGETAGIDHQAMVIEDFGERENLMISRCASQIVGTFEEAVEVAQKLLRKKNEIKSENYFDRSNYDGVTPKLTTKKRILDAAQAIMLEKSFHSVGLSEILQSEGISKGSFYHYFESKEQFGAEMIRDYVATLNDHKRRVLLSSEPESDPRKRIITFLESSIAAFISCGGKYPCLVVKLASEVASFSDEMRQELVEFYKKGSGIMEAVIHEGIEKKILSCELDARRAAILLGDLWIGSLHRASVERNAEPLRTTLDFITQNFIQIPS